MPPEMRLHDIIIWLAAGLTVWAPGAALRALFRPRNASDLLSSIALDCACGLSFWPLAFLFASSLSLRLHAGGITVIVLLSALAAVGSMALRRRPLGVASERKTLALMGLVGGATAFTRLHAARRLVLPPWIDSVHHTMLVRLLVEQGTVPESYDPFIRGAPAFYHWGYHAVVAAIAGVLHSSDPFELARIVLASGQWWNAAACLFVYAAAREWTRSRAAAVLAAAVSGVISYYPAYYLAWGRYTHLAGAILLLGWMTEALRTLRRPVRGQVLMLGVVSAGLVLVHVRMAFFAAVFSIVILTAFAARRAARPSSVLRVAVAFALAGAMALLMISPWLLRLHRGSVIASALSPPSGVHASPPPPSGAGASWDTPNGARADLFWVPHNAMLLSFATAGMSGLANLGGLSSGQRIASVVWWLIAIVLASRTAVRHRSRTAALLAVLSMIAGWCLLVALFLNGAALRLPRMRLATNDAAIITTFLPISIAAGALGAWALRAAVRPHLRWMVLAVVVIAASIFGGVTLSDVMNPGTVIADAGDLQALHWIATSLPQRAVLLGGVQPWYAGTFSGTDGAYWSSVLTGRYSLPPPSLYAWSQPPSLTEPLHAFLRHWKGSYPNVSPALAAEARRAGVTHVYFGARTEPTRRAPPGAMVYEHDGIAIVRLP